MRYIWATMATVWLVACGGGADLGGSDGVSDGGGRDDVATPPVDLYPDPGLPPIDLTPAELDTAEAELPTGCRDDSECEAELGAVGPCRWALCNRSTGVCEATPRSDGTPCDDADPCTEDTICTAGECAPDPGVPHPCDDGNPCTADRCDPEAGEPGERCLHEPQEGPCDDGLGCTDSDQCSAGECLGTALDCDDDNPCTYDLCDEALDQCRHTLSSGPCDDRDACTANDYCRDGACRAGTVLSCDDGNPCTNDVCNSTTGCRHDTNTRSCDDGNPCTEGDGCTDGVCTAGENYTCAACTSDADCAPHDDGQVCNGTLFCFEGRCSIDPRTVVECPPASACAVQRCDAASGLCIPVPAPEGSDCSDDDACTLFDVCVAGACAGQLASCDDGNPCTLDGCADPLGCTHDPNAGGPCDDGDECTNGDACRAGICAPGPNICVTCTDDTDCTVLDDGDLCNGVLRCTNGTCRPAPESVVTCDTSGDTPCRHTRCVPESGRCEAQVESADTPCSDDNACTTSDRCRADGTCAGDLLVCDDGNPCTTDGCDPLVGGCDSIPAPGPCEDGDLCTQGDQCGDGTCRSGFPVVCDDQSPCTDDTCEPERGCVFTIVSVGVPCDDRSLCTADDVCQPDGRCAGAARDCADANPCTDDNCDPVSGECLHPPNTAPCDDGEPCTADDHCQAGGCVGGPPTACDDGNGCTDDSCAPGLGCQNIDNALPCDDGSACTLGDQCAGGTCTSGPAVDCDDGNFCTDDACDPVTGCVHPPSTGPCDDGDVCTVDDGCAAGECQGGPPFDCDDTDPCTDDVCVAFVGCDHGFNTAPCSDGNPCTSNDACRQGTCVGGEVTCHEDACTDGADNDTDGLVDCDDPDCLPVHPCTPVDICSGAQAIACGDTGIIGSLVGPGTTDRIDAWDCWSGAPALHPAPEFAYVFQYSCFGSITFQVQTTAPGSGPRGHALLDIFVLDGSAGVCYPESCVGVGAAQDFPTYARANLTLPVFAERRYYVVVDGRNGDAGNFTISVQCSPQAFAESCGDGFDNDCDGATDCGDLIDCSASPFCNR